MGWKKFKIISEWTEGRICMKKMKHLNVYIYVQSHYRNISGICAINCHCPDLIKYVTKGVI